MRGRPARSTLFPYTTLFRSLNELNRGQSGLETYGLFSNLTHDFKLLNNQIGRAVQQECRDRRRMPSSAWKQKGLSARSAFRLIVAVAPRIHAQSYGLVLDGA